MNLTEEQIEEFWECFLVIRLAVASLLDRLLLLGVFDERGRPGKNQNCIGEGVS